jgi:hypothetical protein
VPIRHSTYHDEESNAGEDEKDLPPAFSTINESFERTHDFDSRSQTTTFPFDSRPIMTENKNSRPQNVSLKARTF